MPAILFYWYEGIIVDTMIIVPFHKDFSPSGEQPEHRKLAREL